MTYHRTRRRTDGTRQQAALDRNRGRERTASPIRAGGLLLRGVVVVTYVQEDDAQALPDGGDSTTPTACYCDVLVYSGLPTMRNAVLHNVLVSQPAVGMHKGKIWKPRATTMDVSQPGGNYVTPPNRAHNPANLDGDHVLVGFLDDSLLQPIILGSLPHPQADLGNENRDVGHRLRLKLEDGDPDFLKHRGSYYGVDTKGSFVMDLTRAHTGGYKSAPTGEEPDPDTADQTIGAFTVRLNEGKKVTIQIAAGPTFTIEGAAGDSIVTVGGGAKKVADADLLQTLYTSLKNAFDGHTHIQALPLHPAVPPTGPTGAPSSPAPTWDAKINNPSVLVPEAPEPPP